MKQLLNIRTFIFISVSVFGQTDSLLIGNKCANQLDTTEVIKIAKKENAWWDKKPGTEKRSIPIIQRLFLTSKTVNGECIQ